MHEIGNNEETELVMNGVVNHLHKGRDQGLTSFRSHVLQFKYLAVNFRSHRVSFNQPHDLLYFFIHYLLRSLTIGRDWLWLEGADAI